MTTEAFPEPGCLAARYLQQYTPSRLAINFNGQSMDSIAIPTNKYHNLTQDYHTRTSKQVSMNFVISE